MSIGKVIADVGSMSNDIAKGSNTVKSMFDILDRESHINPNNEKGEIGQNQQRTLPESI